MPWPRRANAEVVEAFGKIKPKKFDITEATIIMFQMTELDAQRLPRGALHFGFGNPSERSHTWSMHDISGFSPIRGVTCLSCAETMLLPRVYLANN